MSNLVTLLEEREQQLTSLRNTKFSQHPADDATHLHVSTIRGHYRYLLYNCKRKTKRAHRKYLKKQELDKARGLAQYEYDRRLKDVVDQELALIRTLLRFCREDSLGNALTGMHPGKQVLVTPQYLPDAEFVRRWEAEPYEGNPRDFGDTEFYTDRGERVRSKSEIIIANKLNNMGIPYRYEAPLVFPDGITIYPDFTILNVHTRKVMYWEHFGMMQDPDYVSTVLYKLDQMASIGILPGKNLIFTYETDRRSLNLRSVARNIEEFLL